MISISKASINTAPKQSPIVPIASDKVIRPMSRGATAPSEMERESKAKSDKHFFDERAVKVLASQNGIDETKKKLEKEIQQMQDQIKSMAPNKIKETASP